MFVTWTGPTPVDDVIALFDTNNHCNGNITTKGASSGFVMLGFFEAPPAFLAAGVAGGVYGNAVILTAIHYDHSFTTIETSAPVAGFTFDPIGYLPSLLDKIYQLPAAILASVRYTFPAST